MPGEEYSAIMVTEEELIDSMAASIKAHIDKELEKKKKRFFYTGYAFGLLAAVLIMVISDFLPNLERQILAAAIVIFACAYGAFYLFSTIVEWWAKDENND